MFYQVLLVASCIALLCCSGFLGLVVVAAVRFRRQRATAVVPASQFPAVSMLKPLCGLEPNLEANLATFFDQDYPAYEIIFGARNNADPALAVVRSLAESHPGVPVRIVLSGEPDHPNAKVCSLMCMYESASHDHFVISDSDVHVTPSYLREVIAPLLDERNGLVTCVYRGVPTGGLWSRLEALGMSVEMTAGVIVANLLEGMKFALGPTMATRRDVIDSIGGFGVLADYCADDYVLGNRAYESGRTVVLSGHAIDHVVLNRSFRDSIVHQVRWMKSSRFSRPKGHVGTALTFAMPFGIIGLLAGILADQTAIGVALLAWAVLNRVLLSIAVGWGVVGDRRSLMQCWLYPVRDLMGFCFWAASFVGTTIVWRGERYRLKAEGRMVRIPEHAPTASPAVAVDDLA
jgi:ceramide glucosyltransferase